MRFPIAALVGIVVIASCSASPARGDRYGTTPSNASSSPSNFEDFYSKESSRRTTSSSAASTRQDSSTSDLLPLNKSASGTGSSTPSSASANTRASTGTRGTAATRGTTTNDPFARSNTSRAGATTPSSTNSRPSRFDSPTPTYRQNQSSGTTPPSAYNRNSPATVGSTQDRFANSRSLDQRQIDQAGKRETATRNMLSRMLKAHPNSRLTGTPMPLSSLLAGTTSRDRQSQIIEAYWALTSATADYYLGLHEADELGKLRQRVPTYSTALNEVLSNLNNRLDTSLKAAKAAQFHLGQLTNIGTKTLPADTPFCGPYVTRYEEIFAGRGTEQARLLSELLPARLNELQEAAKAVERSEQWISKVAKDRNGSAKGMLMALELLALNRRAFVQIAKDYNLQISRYTRLATPGDIDTGRLVAMLIRSNGSPTLANSQAIANGQSLDFRSGAAASRR